MAEQRLWTSTVRPSRCILGTHQALRSVCCAILALCFAFGSGNAAAPQTVEPLDHAVCRLIESAARANQLPVSFMTRVIWHESSFRAAAISPAGAEGIAQFMPATAQARGLADPFDPEQAIPKAAHLLDELRRQFGNLGFAAAAYNAGAARVASWLHGQGELPAETRRYVRLITARSTEEWRGGEDAAQPAEDESCLALAAELRQGRGGGVPDEIDGAPLAPWGVQLAGNFSKALALAAFERARHRYAAAVGGMQPMIIGRLLRSRGTRRFYQVRLPAASRQAADALCRRIHWVGGNCVALRS